MSQAEGKEQVSLSNEFFKKLNQQIIQKDNLIKLLQLQIKNLKKQIEDSPGGGAVADGGGEQLAAQLAAKEEEIQELRLQIEQHKQEVATLAREKDDEVKALSDTLEEYKRKATGADSGAGGGPVNFERIAELEAEVAATAQKLAASDAEVKVVKGELRNRETEVAALTAKLAAVEGDAARIGEIPALQARIQELEAAMVPAGELAALRERAEMVPDLEARLAARAAEVEALTSAQAGSDLSTTRIQELEQDVTTLKELLAEKDAVINSLQGSPAAGAADADAGLAAKLEELSTELAAVRAENNDLRAKLAELEKRQAESAAQVDSAEIERARAAENAARARVAELELEIATLREQLTGLEIARDGAAKLEAEVARLRAELTAANARAADAGLVTELKADKTRLENLVAQFTSDLDQRGRELAEVKAALVTAQAAASRPPVDTASQAEVEKLTEQVADQLLAIQKLEERSRLAQEAATAKDQELALLRQQLANAPVRSTAIPMPSDSEIIANFIDFFDGLDAFLSRNPNPELQGLHQKLLERLIKPNQIEYMQVISEEFDEARHVATDFFRSKRFPERCIVFEVEKGYRKGEQVVKKPKVWVVQNIFNCQACGAPQNHEDSRFCFRCGTQLMSPNGLPLDHLPTFEPTVTTFLKFSERMIERGDLARARAYLEDGLALDSNYVPLLVRLADVKSLESDFSGALELLKRASQIKTDPRILEKLRDVEVKNTIFQQARALGLPPDKFEELRQLIQK